MNKEQALALTCARLAIGAETATVMVRQLVSLIDDLEKLDEERRRSLNEITAARDELREQHAQCVADAASEALHEVECPNCHTTIRARMADAPRSGRFQIEHPPYTQTRRPPEGQAVDLPVPAPRYMEQAQHAGDLARWLELVKAAGFYPMMGVPDAIHYDIDFSPRDESNDPPWRWGIPVGGGKYAPVTPLPDDALHDQLQEDAARDHERENEE